MAAGEEGLLLRHRWSGLSDGCFQQSHSDSPTTTNTIPHRSCRRAGRQPCKRAGRSIQLRGGTVPYMGECQAGMVLQSSPQVFCPSGAIRLRGRFRKLADWVESGEAELVLRKQAEGLPSYSVFPSGASYCFFPNASIRLRGRFRELADWVESGEAEVVLHKRAEGLPSY